MSFADDQRVYVATYKEIFLIFITFAVILFVLFPKDLLKEQILKETSNYDLSMLYLKNMLNHDPSNESLMLMLASQSLRSGNRDLSLRLLELLLRSENLEVRQEAYALSYKLAKENYHFVQTKKQKAEIKKDLKKLFIGIIINHFYKNNLTDLSRWYNEAVFLNLDTYALNLLKQKIILDPNNLTLLHDGYFLADKLKREKDVLKFIHLLQQKDALDRDKWLMNEYYYYTAKKEFSKAESLLRSNAKISLTWQEMLAQFYLSRKKYIEASRTYMQLYHRINNKEDKKLYFIEAVKTLQAGGYLRNAVALGHQYENRYYKNPKIRIFLLRLYISANDLEKAAALSKRILKDEIK